MCHLFDAKYATGKRDNFRRQKRKDMERKQLISIIVDSQVELFHDFTGLKKIHCMVND